MPTTSNKSCDCFCLFYIGVSLIDGSVKGPYATLFYKSDSVKKPQMIQFVNKKISHKLNKKGMTKNICTA